MLENNIENLRQLAVITLLAQSSDPKEFEGLSEAKQIFKLFKNFEEQF